VITDQEGGKLFDAITTEMSECIKGVSIIPIIAIGDADHADKLRQALHMCDGKLRRIIQDFIMSHNQQATQAPERTP